MPERDEVTVVNSHHDSLHVIGRRFRPGRPRTLRLNESQLRSVRGHPWLTIEEEEDDEEEAEPSGPTATHVGGGWYRLNGGSLVQGRDNLPTNCEVV